MRERRDERMTCGEKEKEGGRSKKKRMEGVRRKERTSRRGRWREERDYKREKVTARKIEKN